MRMSKSHCLPEAMRGRVHPAGGAQVRRGRAQCHLAHPPTAGGALSAKSSGGASGDGGT